MSVQREAASAALVCTFFLCLLAARTQARCVGDCDDHLTVTTDEVLVGTNQALGLDGAGCSAFRVSLDGRVTVDDLVLAVGNSIRGCRADADDNGLPDAVECGAHPPACVDSDGDTVADAQDTDDDGDGLLDANDAERRDALVDSDAFDPATRIVLTSARTEIAGGGAVAGTARVGETLTLVGEGFAADAAGNVVVFEGPGGPLNVLAAAGTTTQLEVVVPTGAGSPVRVVHGGRRSNALPLRILAAGAPILFDLDTASVQVGDEAVLRGRGLEDVTTVDFAGAAAAPSSTAGDVLKVVVPPGARTGDLTATSALGVSNAIAVRVSRNAGAKVILLPRANLDVTTLLVSAGLEESVHPGADGSAGIRISRSGADLVTAVIAGDDGNASAVYLEAVALPGDTLVVLDSLSTAVALLLDISDLPARASLDAIEQARSQLAALPAVQALGDAIAAGLAADPAFLQAPPPSFTETYQTALLVADAIFRAALPATARAAGAAGEAMAGQATIVPTGGFDCAPAMLPACSEQSDVLLRQIPGTGNVELQNDTMLYLSVEMRDLQRNFLYAPHVTSYLDPLMVGTQEGLLWGFNAASREYAAPQYHGAAVDVVTAGLADPAPQTPAAQNARFWLVVRTTVDRVVLPIVVFAAGQVSGQAANLGPKPELAAIIIATMFQSAPEAMEAVRAAVADGNAPSAVGIILTILKNDFVSVGPITSALGQQLFGQFEEGLAKRLIIRFARVLLPGISAAEAAVLVINTGATATNVAKTVVDFETTPGLLHYEVFFEMTVAEVLPGTIERVPEPRVLTIRGFGFFPLPDGTPPVVELVDRGGGLFPTVRTPDTLALRQLDADGRTILVDLEAAYVSTVFGPLHLTVTRGSETAAAPADIDVTGELAITAIAPQSGSPGTAIELTGSGFDTRPQADVRLRFRDSPGSEFTQFDGVDVVVDSATRIRARVPDLPPDQSWNVFVEQGPLTRRVLSNPVFFGSGAEWLPPPVGVIRLWNVGSTDAVPNTTFLWLTPDHNAFMPPRNLIGPFGDKIGTWSLSGQTLRIEPCITPATTAWIEFEGTVQAAGGDFQVCCLEPGPSCGPRPCLPGTCVPRPCPAIHGILKGFVRDVPQGPGREVRRFEVDDRYYDGVRYTSFPPDGFYPLRANLDWTCPAQCLEHWEPPSSTTQCHCTASCQ